MQRTGTTGKPALREAATAVVGALSASHREYWDAGGWAYSSVLSDVIANRRKPNKVKGVRALQLSAGTEMTMLETTPEQKFPA